MSSPANKEQFLKQFEQIVEGVKNNKAKVIFFSVRRNQH
jgi:quinol monooxygenase YgiN